MPREMQYRSLDGTRWTSTRAMPTLIAPHGGAHGLDGLNGCGCNRRARNGGLSGCGCSARQKLLVASRGLAGLGTVGPTQIDTLKPNERTLVSIEQYVFGQPPLDVQKAATDTERTLRELGYTDVKIGSTTSYPLAWSWAWEAGPKVWTAYVSNPDAGPFKNELNIQGSSYYLAQDAAPGVADMQSLPTQGVIFTIDALPSTETLSPEALGTLRESLRRNTQGNLSRLRQYIHVKGTPKPESRRWWLALLLFGGLGAAAYAGSDRK